MANPNINSFGQTPVQGQMDLSFVGAVVTAYVSANQATALIAGQCVKGDNTAPGTAQDGPPPVMALASASDPCIGFVSRNIKDINAPTYSRVELAMAGSCMYMTATAAITRFGPVEYNTSTNKVTAWAGVNPIVGYAYDAAISADDLIRVLIRSPQIGSENTTQLVKTVNVTATLAQINAGLTLIPGVTGKKITLLDYTARVNGSSFAGGTNVLLQSTNGTPVVASTIAEAGLVSGAVLKPTSANTTLGAGFSVPLGTSDGLQVAATGTHTTATGITFTLTYNQA